jgi:predicted RNA-binding Zn-ribbon protein involved in translation (DUF1610 family)
MKLKLFTALRGEVDRGTLKCPFCRDSIYPAVTITRCSSCRTVHHEKCWQDNHQCSVFGCAGTPQLEHTEFYLIESFQKRRKKLIRSWFASFITTIVVLCAISYLLREFMPIEGRILFSGAVAIFIIAIIVLNSYAQYLCPACGHQPRIIRKERKFFLWPIIQNYDIIHSELIWNPANCPNCKVRLR